MAFNNAPRQGDGLFLAGHIRCPGCGHQVRAVVRLSTRKGTYGPEVIAREAVALPAGNHLASCEYGKAAQEKRDAHRAQRTSIDD